MTSIRIENKDIYKIEVNDKGEYIEFNLNDVSNSIRLSEALKEIRNIQKETETKYKELRENLKEDENGNVDDDYFEKYALLEQEMFTRMRNAMDKVLGENACQKIFGDRNYYEMFNDLLEELSKPRKELNNKSHLDMISMKAEDVHKRIEDKYKKTSEVVI